MKSHKINSPGWNFRPKWGANILGILIILVLLLTPSTQGFSATNSQEAPESPSAAWNLHVVDGPPFYYFMTDRSMRHDRSVNHVPCVAYGGDHLYFSCYNKLANTWSVELVDSNLMVGSYAALDFNSLNMPFISYYDAYNATLKLAFKVGLGWSKITVDVPSPAPPLPTDSVEIVEPEALTPEQIQETQQSFWDQLLANFPHLRLYAPGFFDAAIGVGKHTSIDIDANNQIHISYYDEQNGALKYAYWNGIGLPVVETVDIGHQSDLGLWTSIEADEWLRPQISYMDEKYDDLKFAIKMGNSWDIKLVDNGVNVGPFSSIALGLNDSLFGSPRLTPHIVYMAFNYDTGKFALKYAKLQTNNVNWSKTTIDPSIGVGLFASLAIDDDEHLHASYYDGWNGNLRYATSANGDNWNVTQLATTGDQGLFSSIDIGPNDKPAISYFDSTNGSLEFIYKDANTWKTASVIGYSSNVGLLTSLSISNLGVPHISYLNETRGLLKYARAFGSTWGTEVITDTAYLGTFNSLDLAFESIPMVAFYDAPHGDLILTSKSGSTWVDDLVDQYDDVGAYVSLAIGLDGIPHMSYVDATWDLLNYAKWDIVASDWATQTVDYFDVGGNTSIAIGEPDIFGNRLPGISYFDFLQEQIRHAYLTPFLSWQHIPIASIGDPNDQEPILEPFNSIDYDNLGFAHIAFYDETLGDLRYAYFNGITWVYSTLDAIGDVGRFVSLAIDRVNNHRHICYYDDTNRDLKYAYWDGISWSIEIVDALGDVGMDCSIDLNGAGLPGISYYDASNADLKYAAAYTLPPAMIFLPVVFHP